MAIPLLLVFVKGGFSKCAVAIAKDGREYADVEAIFYALQGQTVVQAYLLTKK